MNDLGLVGTYEFWFEIPFDVVGSSMLQALFGDWEGRI